MVVWGRPKSLLRTKRTRFSECSATASSSGYSWLLASSVSETRLNRLRGARLTGRTISRAFVYSQRVHKDSSPILRVASFAPFEGPDFERTPASLHLQLPWTSRWGVHKSGSFDPPSTLHISHRCCFAVHCGSAEQNCARPDSALRRTLHIAKRGAQKCSSRPSSVSDL